MYCNNRVISIYLAILILVLCSAAYCQLQTPQSSGTLLGTSATTNPTGLKPVRMLKSITFNPATAVVARVGNSWKIVDGATVILDFGPSQMQAATGLNVIKYYGMNSQYLIGVKDTQYQVGAQKGMQFYLVNGAAPSGPMSGENCVNFDPNKLQVHPMNQVWWVAQTISQGWTKLLSFDTESDATDALNAIRTNGFTCMGSVGSGPDAPMMYFRKGTALNITFSAQLTATLPAPPDPTPVSSSSTSGDDNPTKDVKDKGGKDPTAYDTNVTFAGSITVSAPCTVSYKLVYDDGTAEAEHTLQINSAGMQTLPIVQKSFHKHEYGWGVLKITSPVKVESPKAAFHDAHH